MDVESLGSSLHLHLSQADSASLRQLGQCRSAAPRRGTECGGRWALSVLGSPSVPVVLMGGLREIHPSEWMPLGFPSIGRPAMEWLAAGILFPARRTFGRKHVAKP